MCLDMSRRVGGWGISRRVNGTCGGRGRRWLGSVHEERCSRLRRRRGAVGVGVP